MYNTLNVLNATELVNIMLCKFHFIFFFFFKYNGWSQDPRESERDTLGAYVPRNSAPNSAAKPIWVDSHATAARHRKCRAYSDSRDTGATFMATKVGNPMPF